MTQPISDIAFTPTVKAIQERLGSRDAYAGMEARGGWNDTVTPDLVAFIAGRDSLFLGTATAEGRPYIQHRGGAKGFLKVVGDRTLAFADFAGNRQYISTGNLADNNRAFIFLIDFAHRRRIKIWGWAEVVEDDPALLERLADPEYHGKPERALVFHVEAWDVNCPQHIPRLLGEDEVAAVVADLETRIDELEQENARLRGAAATVPTGA